MIQRRGHVPAIVGGLVAGTLVSISVRFTLLNGMSLADFAASFGLSNLLIGISLSAVAVLLLWFKPGFAIGPLFLAAGLVYLISAAAIGGVLEAQQNGWPSLPAGLVGTLFLASWPFAIGFFLPVALLLFPSGRLQGLFGRVLFVLLCANALPFVATYAFSPADFPVLISLSGYSSLAPLWLTTQFINVALWSAMFVQMVLRYRRGSPQVRGQILWVALALVVVLSFTVPFTLFGIGEVAVLLVLVAIPLAVTVAVLRYQLLDIRLVFSRALAWLLLTGATLGLYALLVAALSSLLSTPSTSVIAALVVALAFEPVRRLLQRLIDRLVYGRRGTDHVLRLLGGGIAGASDVGSLLDMLARSLRLPALSLRVEGIGEIAAVGREVTAHDPVFELVTEGVTVGRLTAGLRSGEGSFGRADLRVMELLVPLFTLLAESLRLSRDLARSRGRVVEAAEGERVRLQRDLHDGIASAITGVTFKVAAARANVTADPHLLPGVLDAIDDDLHSILGSLRIVIDDLRPPELDQVGLVKALEDKWGRTLHNREALPVQIYFRADDLRKLPPAVEIAAYRIANEALTNVLRHSNAAVVTVDFSRTDETLKLGIRDDGDWTVPWTAGTGMRSMRERAELLDGTFSAGPANGGGVVEVKLPVSTGRAAIRA